MFYREIRFIGNLQTVTNIMIQDKIYIFTTEYQIKDGVHVRFDNGIDLLNYCKKCHGSFATTCRRMEIQLRCD